MSKVTDLSTRRKPVVPAIHRALRQGVDDGAFPGGAVCVWWRGRLVHLSSTGDAQVVPTRVAMADDAVFDLASLTKILATTPAALALVARRMLSLDDRVVRYWPSFGRAAKAGVTVRHLLAHASGLPAWRPMFLAAASDPGAAPLFTDPPPEPRRRWSACRRGRAIVEERVATTALEAKPATRAVYSDLGFIALGKVIEAIAGERLDRFVETEVLPELGLEGLAFRPLNTTPRLGPPLVATGVVRPREPAPGQEGEVPLPDPSKKPAPRPGEVDDDNAFAMGGVAGHAGLFGSAELVAAFGNAVLEELAGATRLSPPDLWHEACRRDRTPGTTRALGFDTPGGPSTSAGTLIGAGRALGHTGFTGTSLWIDLGRELSVALLTNRVHPTRANTRITAFRPGFHDAVVRALGLAPEP